jgi:hypothetical protein
MQDLKKIIIIDLDGTLADSSLRKHHVEGVNKDWASFYFNIPYDNVNLWCKELVLGMISRSVESLFVSGRPETMESNGVVHPIKEWTLDWLQTQFQLTSKSFFEEKLFMRASGDKREDFIIKKELYEDHIKGKYEVLFVVDDRRQVVNMWRSEGLVVLHCADGNF